MRFITFSNNSSTLCKACYLFRRVYFIEFFILKLMSSMHIKICQGGFQNNNSIYCQITNQNRKTLEKVQYTNTIVVGLEGLIKGNENYAYVVKQLRAKAKELLAPSVAALAREGYVLLPNTTEFTKLAVPDSATVLYVNEHLFAWQGAISLRPLGGQLVQGLVAGEDKLPLVVVPFTAEAIAPVADFDRNWWNRWTTNQRIPILVTDRFVAIPAQLADRLVELSVLRLKGLPDELEKEFLHMSQIVNIMTAQEVVTSYEVAPPRANLALLDVQFEESLGQVDSAAINNFLVKPPEGIEARLPAQAGIPADTKQHLIRLDSGALIEAESRKVLRERDILDLEFLQATNQDLK